MTDPDRCQLCALRPEGCTCPREPSEDELELARHLRAATRRTLRTDLPEAERLASRIAEAR